MVYLPGLAVALTLLWFALSGMTSPLFLVLAGFSILATLWLSAKLDVVDREGSPYLRAPQFLVYSGWLALEVIKSNIKVIAAILGPKGAIDPGFVMLEAGATTGLGKAVFANSITLTPGTVTVDVSDGRLVVHALDLPGSGPETFLEMDRRSRKAADGRG